MNNNQFNPNEQNQQNTQYNPNQQYQQNQQQNQQYNPNQQYQQNNQYNPNQQYQQNNQYNPNQQYQQYNQYNPNQQYQQPNGEDFFDKIKSFILDTPVEKEQIAPQDIQENGIISLASYLLFGILFWLPLVGAKNSRFARFHANQSLVFFFSSIIIWLVYPIACVILNFIPIIGTIVSFLLPFAISAVQIGYTVLGIYNSVKGRANELPVIGKFRLIKTVPVVNVNYNNVNNNNYNAPNNYNNMPNTNANYNATAQNGVESNAYNNINQNTGFNANAYSSGAQQTNTDTAEQSTATPNLSLNKNDSSNS